MQLDLIIRHANLPDGRTNMDIGIAKGRVETVEPALEASAVEEIDATGRLVTPPFVDAHFHMDATLVLTAIERRNESGTLFEGIRMWGELQSDLTQEAMLERALAYCDTAVAQGLLAVRSHVDICDDRFFGVEALIEAKKRVAPYLDLQLVAFPQQGYLKAPNAIKNMLRAMDRGVDVIGGIPHFERTEGEGAESTRLLCRLAADRGLMVDLHCDETDDPMSRQVEHLAAEARRLGLKGRIAGSHLCSMHSMDNQYFSKLLPLLVEAEVRCIANPLANMVLQGRYDTYPKRRGMMRVPELMAAGITVAFGHDSVLDPWYPLGNADMLEVAHMGVHAGHMTGQSAMRACFDAVTANPAKILGLEGYGIEPGCNGDLVVLQAADPVEALRVKATRLFVIRRGKVIARTAPKVAQLSLPGRRETLDGASIGVH